MTHFYYHKHFLQRIGFSCVPNPEGRCSLE